MLQSKPNQTHTCRILRFASATEPPINTVAREKKKNRKKISMQFSPKKEIQIFCKMTTCFSTTEGVSFVLVVPPHPPEQNMDQFAPFCF